MYKANVSCSNCGLSAAEVEIPKGTTIDQAECPQCGNQTLRRHFDPTIPPAFINQ